MSLGKLAALRESLRRLAPNAIPAVPADGPVGAWRNRMPTGASPLDRLLGGGLPCGGITELCGEASSGKTSLALSMAASCTAAGDLAAYLNAKGQLYPPAAAALGVDLTRLLIINFDRSRSLEIDIARAADILIRSRRFPLIIIDAPALTPRRVARLRQSAHATDAALVCFGDRQRALSGAAARLQVWPRRSAGTPVTTRAVEVHIDKGSHRSHLPSSRVVVELEGHRIDHAPGRELAPILVRTEPGVPPVSPQVDRSYRENADRNQGAA